jgi:DNA polymerase elongation subunit (family B)
MFKNVYYDKRNNKIHLWEELNGEQLYSLIDWVPYVFVDEKVDVNKRNLDSNIEYKCIEGTSVKKVKFGNYNDYFKFCENKNFIYENKVKPEIQFLVDRYYKIPDDELYVPKLKIYSLDIEVHMEEAGFSNIKDTSGKICLITVYDNIKNEAIVFGEKEYTGEYNGKLTYIYCSDEEKLLKRFFTFMNRVPCDILTGWNIYYFDIPYIIKRSQKLFGDKTKKYYDMSPINIVSTWDSSYGEMNIDIPGINILDYMHLYKTYTQNNLERYSLDFVTKFELEKGKVDYSEEAENLRELYHKNWNKYVEYNIYDAKRVQQLERKLGYISLVQYISLISKCPMKFYDKQTSIIEGAMLTHLRRTNRCAPIMKGGEKKDYDAAYVKEPKPGKYKWVVDADVTSEYPHCMITLNISNETYYGIILDMTEQDIIENVRKRKFPNFSMYNRDEIRKHIHGETLEKFNVALTRGLLAIAPNGAIFKTNKIGLIPEVEKIYFGKRKIVKNKLIEAKKKNDIDEITKLKAVDNTSKLILNAIYGALAIPYSRYFNVNMASAITAAGRHIVKQGQIYINEILNNPNEELNKILERIKNE